MVVIIDETMDPDSSNEKENRSEACVNEELIESLMGEMNHLARQYSGPESKMISRKTVEKREI